MDNFIILLFIVFTILWFDSRRRKKNIKQTLTESTEKLANILPPETNTLTNEKMKEILDFWDINMHIYNTYNINEVTSVLLKLGYKPKQIKETIFILNTEKLTTEDMIKQALVILNK